VPFFRYSRSVDLFSSNNSSEHSIYFPNLRAVDGSFLYQLLWRFKLLSKGILRAFFRPAMLQPREMRRVIDGASYWVIMLARTCEGRKSQEMGRCRHIKDNKND
jgi:hypothetical protein